MRIDDSGVDIDDLVSAVKGAIKRANISTTDTSRDLRVTTARLTLHAIAASTAGGSLDFRVPFLGMRLKLGGTVSRRDTHTIEIALVPPDLDAPELRDGPIETALVDAIAAIRRVVALAATGDDPFVLATSSIDITFAVNATGSISIGADSGFNDEITHTLHIGLSPTAPSTR